MRVLATVAVWGAAAVVTLAVAAGTAVGPVIGTLAPSHGVHLGDVVAMGAAAAVAATVTAAIWADRHR